MSSSLRLSIIVNCLCIAGLLALVCYFVARPVTRLQSAHEDMQELTRGVNIKGNELSKISIPVEDRISQEVVEEALEEWEALAASESERIAALSLAARDSGVMIVSLESLPPTEDPARGLASRAHRLAGVGSYRQLAEFVDGVTSSRGMVLLDDLTIEPFDGKDPDSLRASLSVTWIAPSRLAQDHEEASP
jgi:hypothetical protein